MEKIFEIEERYPQVKDLRFNDVKIWPVYRIILRFLLLNNQASQPASEIPVAHGLVALIKQGYFKLRHLSRVVKALPRFFGWLRRYDYIIFSNDLEKREVGNMMIDKLATGVIEQLGEKRTLLINYPSGNTSKRNTNFRHSRLVNGEVINSLANLLGPVKTNMPEKDRQLIEIILREYNLPGSGLDQIDFFFRKTKILGFLLKRWQPRLVINCCYTYQAEVYVSKNKGIRTIELQHGIISPLHPAYDSSLQGSKDFTAEFLLSFGENSTKGLSNNIVDLARTIPVGNLYLEELYHLPADPVIQSMVAGFASSVCVPTDFTTEDEILDFIVELAVKDVSIGFFIVPRLNLSVGNAERVAKVDNIRVLEAQSFQNVVRHCDIHTATVSTCCLEALTLGVPNILIDRNGRAEDIYGGLVDTKYTFFVSSLDDFFFGIEKLKSYSKEEIRNSNYKNFSNNYRENLSKALEVIQSRR